MVVIPWPEGLRVTGAGFWRQDRVAGAEMIAEPQQRQAPRQQEARQETDAPRPRPLAPEEVEALHGDIQAAGISAEDFCAYLHELVGEIISGQPEDGYSNRHMERGSAWEAEAREAYASERMEAPEIVGIALNHGAGASPDSLIGADGVLEIKTLKPSLMVKEMLMDRPPPEHRAQVQGLLWVCERQWCDLALYSRGFDLRVYRIARDEEFIAKLAEGVAAFNRDISEAVEKIRPWRAA